MNLFNKRILVVRFSSLGDVVLTTPVFKNIKSAYPDSFVAVAVKKQFADVFKGNPYIDEIVALGQSESLWGFILKVRRMKFDVLLDLHNNLRSHLLSIFSG